MHFFFHRKGRKGRKGENYIFTIIQSISLLNSVTRGHEW
jgi:hypothetical protein